MNSQAFPKTARLLKHADFERVYKTGERMFAKDLTLFFTRDNAEAAQKGSPVRVGLTVGRALGGAVLRNRIKRRVREAIRKNLHEISLPMDVVVNPKKSAAAVEFGDLEKQVRQSFIAIARREKGPGRIARSSPHERKRK